MSEDLSKLMLEDVSALIPLLDKAGWRHVSVCSETLRLVLSKDAEVSKQMDQLTEGLPEPVEASDALIVSAPHLGTVHLDPETSARVGDSIIAGQSLLTLQVLDQQRPIRAPVDGTICEVLVDEGVLAEFGTPLISITPQ